MATTPTISDDELLTLLAKATDGGAHREQKSAKADGLFPSGAKGKALAAAARDRGLIEHCPDPAAPPPKGKGKAPKFTHVRLTTAGREQVLQRLSPKAALEALHQLLESRAPAPSDTDGTSALAAQVAELRAAVDRVHTGLAAAADSRRAETVEWRQLLGILEGKVREAVDQTKKLTAPPAAESSSAAAPDATQLADETVRFVEGWSRDRGYACRFDELKAHLDAIAPGLSVGAFHDLLRRLHDAGRIQLGGWGQTLDEIPRPELALFVSHKVMYHVDPSDRPD